MNYSFYPLVDVTVNNFEVILAFVFYALGIAVFYDFLMEGEIVDGVGSFLVCALVGSLLYVNGKYEHHYENTQVIGEYVSTVAEGYSERSGKSKADHHISYVVYKVPEGNVMFQACPGQAYPQRAILYKN